MFTEEILKLRQYLKRATGSDSQPVQEKSLGASAAALEADSVELNSMKARFNRILANFERDTQQQEDSTESKEEVPAPARQVESDAENEYDVEQENCGDVINLKIGMPLFCKRADKPPKPHKVNSSTPERGQTLLGKSQSNSSIPTA